MWRPPKAVIWCREKKEKGGGSLNSFVFPAAKSPPGEGKEGKSGKEEEKGLTEWKEGLFLLLFLPLPFAIGYPPLLPPPPLFPGKEEEEEDQHWKGEEGRKRPMESIGGGGGEGRRNGHTKK